MTSLPSPVYNETTIPASTMSQERARWKSKKAFLITGILHLSIGGACIVLGICAIVFYGPFSKLAMPIWGGLLLYGSTGLVGIFACTLNRLGLIYSYMIMCIISSSMALTMLIMYSLAASVDIWVDSLVTDSLLTVMSIAEGVVSIVGASFTCWATSCKCDCNPAYPPSPVTVHFMNSGGIIAGGSRPGVINIQGGMPSGAQWSTQPAYYVVAPVNTGLPPPQAFCQDETKETHPQGGF